MMVEMICAGFGGQGVLTTGLILAEAGMKLGMNVLWYPSYGSEMRGGTANCTIKFSDKEIASPCAKKIDILMAMNAPAIDKFESSLRPGGLLLVNSSLVHEREYRDDIRVVKVPMTEIAAEQENPKGANIVMMGAMAANSDLFTEDERTENYINYFHKYPAWYRGRRDEAMLERMRNDMDFDQETMTCTDPVGRMVDGDFVYTGETRKVKVG